MSVSGRFGTPPEKRHEDVGHRLSHDAFVNGNEPEITDRRSLWPQGRGVEVLEAAPEPSERRAEAVERRGREEHVIFEDQRQRVSPSQQMLPEAVRVTQ